MIIQSLVGVAILQQSSVDDAPERILNEVQMHGKAMGDLQYLSDDIGPRLTGSTNLARAENWIADKLKEYGAENVHMESYIFPSRWERGQDDFACLVTQSKRQMTVHAMAWNPSTKGLIMADLALVSGPVEDLLKDMSRFKGKIAVLGNLQLPKNEAVAAKLEHQFYESLGKQAVAILASLEHYDGKFTMYGSPEDWYFDRYFGGWPRLPFGFLIQEDRAMLARLLLGHEKVTMKLRLGGAITKRNVTEHNVVGEIRGTEKPDEVVIVGGHLDSWDLGTGTTDNGTGSIATLETLRAMHTLGLKPKRTIRFVFFTGEEQGSQGAKAYVKAHKSELANYQAVLIHDLGAGKPSGFTVQGHGEWVPLLKKAMEPLAKIGVTNIPIEQHWDSDQDDFVEQGVPGFFLDQDTKDYFDSTHHSQTDMLNHVKLKDYLPSIQALAVAAWEFANMPERVPHVAPGHVVGPDKDKPKQ
ncbi:MAG: M20/M25/M40 family metallo-hydrolase [Armatimonadetes bacterium]|nr:M20/M25/M40 family metallo-hydrolase [Armatimonadota bacterium]